MKEKYTNGEYAAVFKWLEEKDACYSADRIRDMLINKWKVEHKLKKMTDEDIKKNIPGIPLIQKIIIAHKHRNNPAKLQHMLDHGSINSAIFRALHACYPEIGYATENVSEKVELFSEDVDIKLRHYDLHISRNEMERLIIESEDTEDDVINDIFCSLPENVTPYIVGEPRFDELDDIYAEAEARVWMYRSYMNTANDSNIPADIIDSREAVRNEYKKEYNLGNHGEPLDDAFDSYEYWEGVLAACRYFAGDGLFMSIDNIRTGEDLLDT